MKEANIFDIKRFLDLYFQESICLAMGQCDIESNLQMKYSHSLSVYKLVQKIAAGLHLNNQTTLRVRAAALLHDLGRFSQITGHQTYEDLKSIDHADLGVRILQEKKVIAHLGTEVSEVIKAAVRHHNKLTLPPGMEGQVKTITEVLRDADKIDIMRIAIEFHSSELKGIKTGWFTEMSFSPSCNRIVATSLLAGKPVPIAEIDTVYDEFLLYLSWVNDLHFDVSVRCLSKLGRLEYMINALPDDTLRTRVTEYISRKIAERFSVKM